MNLYITHPDPSISANWLDDKLVDNQLRVCAHLVSDAIGWLSPECAEGFYKKRYVNRWSQWIMTSRENFFWLMNYACTMGNHRMMYNKRHKSHGVLVRALDLDFQHKIFPDGELTPFPKFDITGLGNPYYDCRKYLVGRWLTYTPVWSGVARVCPDWALDELRAKWGSGIPELMWHCYDVGGYTLKTQRDLWAKSPAGRAEIYSCVE